MNTDISPLKQYVELRNYMYAILFSFAIINIKYSGNSKIETTGGES
jgi:hypothetical protein